MRSRHVREADLARLLPRAAIEPDGRLITTEVRYVRAPECETVPNPVSAGEDTLQRIGLDEKAQSLAVGDLGAQPRPPVRDPLQRVLARADGVWNRLALDRPHVAPVGCDE